MLHYVWRHVYTKFHAYLHYVWRLVNTMLEDMLSQINYICEAIFIQICSTWCQLLKVNENFEVFCLRNCSKSKFYGAFLNIINLKLWKILFELLTFLASSIVLNFKTKFIIFINLKILKPLETFCNIFCVCMI